MSDDFWVGMGIVAGVILTLSAVFGVILALIFWPIYVGPVLILILLGVALKGIRAA